MPLLMLPCLSVPGFDPCAAWRSQVQRIEITGYGAPLVSTIPMLSPAAAAAAAAAPSFRRTPAASCFSDIPVIRCRESDAAGQKAACTTLPLRRAQSLLLDLLACSA